MRQNLDREITLQHRVSGTQDANGQYSPITYSDYATVWARKIEVSGSEFLRAGTKDAQTSVRFEIRWRDDVVATDRLTCEDRDYELIAPPSEIGRKDGLTIFARAVVNA